MAWYNDFMDVAGEVITESITEISSLGLDWKMIAGDALKGAVIAGVNGDDVWKSAAWSGFGSAVGSSDWGKSTFGDYSAEVGGAISGYGVATSNEQDGLLGALAGAAYKNSEEDSKVVGTIDEAPESATPASATPESATPEVIGSESQVNVQPKAEEIAPVLMERPELLDDKGFLEEVGLLDGDGQPTFAGSQAWGLLKGAMGEKNRQTLIKEQKELAQFKRNQLLDDNRRAVRQTNRSTLGHFGKQNKGSR